MKSEFARSAGMRRSQNQIEFENFYFIENLRRLRETDLYVKVLFFGSINILESVKIGV